MKKGKDNFYELYDYENDPHETRNLAVVEKQAYEPLIHKFSRDIRSQGEADGCKALLRTQAYSISEKDKILVRDADSDGVLDEDEPTQDSNKNGILDYLDADS